MRVILILLLILICNFGYGQNAKQNSLLAEIDDLINKSKNPSFTIGERTKYAYKSDKISKELAVDSITLKVNRNMALIYAELKDYDNYISINKVNVELAKKLKDTSGLAVANLNLGGIYKLQSKNDSAYYFFSTALKYYNAFDELEQKAYVLMSIANLQYNEKDYTSSEYSAIRAIKILDALPETENNLDNLWILYNRIGDISSELGDFEKSLEYHDKAIAIADSMEDGFINKIYSINNMAFVYRELKNYKKTLELYRSLVPLKSKYQDYDPTFYALIINNIAYTEFLDGSTEYNRLQNTFYDAYKLAEVNDDEVTKMAVTTDLSKFYLKRQKLDSAYIYAKETYDISKYLSSNDYTLEALLILSQIKEGEEGKKYLNEHIKLTDSLLNLERNSRNKSARIEFDSDQLEAENEQISKENLYLVIVSIGLLLTAILVYIVISQRAKNRKLKLLQVQQKANEDIYNLMLGQQDKVDEARAKEKIRVSKELHDGVLGRLFGTRLSLDSMNFKDGKDAMMTRANYIGQLKTIEDDIRKISHELNTDFVSGTGFMDIVTELIENQAQAYKLAYDFNYTDDISWDLVSNKIKINIYRIIQESMQNIYKHANAKEIKISISLEKDVICLDIIDDGKGFDKSKNKKGIGLKNMSSRVEDINGEIAFTSQPDNGTTVKVKIPYTKQ
ncbi:ATP-binding protein [Winogradskyella sp. PE311]|uniref:tetratricopeptide repeat-containing sensor histidine kinase n=1 Tax=Winogradskyella sp. PE311 TaxID=3366943 RepID=UPI0039800A2D